MSSHRAPDNKRKLNNETRKLTKTLKNCKNDCFQKYCSGTCRQKSLWFLPSKSATQETMFTQTRANYRSIDLRRFRSLVQIRRFCHDHRPRVSYSKKPTIVNKVECSAPVGTFREHLRNSNPNAFRRLRRI